MMLTERQEKFLTFVKERHGFQVRKYTGEPYWTHTYEVAEIVKSVTNKSGLIEVALGHDLVEDTETSFGEAKAILIEIGYSESEAEFITEGIYHLTDQYDKETFPELNRKKRKKLEVIRLGRIPSQFQTVKYADLIHNSSSIIERDPKFAKVYLNEKREILSKMNKGNKELYNKCFEIIN